MSGKQKFPPVAFEHIEKGYLLEGEFVCETSNAWQVAVKGEVQLVKKDEWKPVSPHRGQNGFESLFGDVFGSGPFGGDSSWLTSM